MCDMTLEEKIVEWACANGCLPELCLFVDYDPDIGRVPEHWVPRGDVLALVRSLFAAQADAPVAEPVALNIPEELRNFEAPKDGKPATFADFIKRTASHAAYMAEIDNGDASQWALRNLGIVADAMADALATRPPAPEEGKDAARYRWLRQQHEGRIDQELDADGVPMPSEPTAIAFTVFRPGEVGECHLEPVGCMPGELDGAIDTAMACAALSQGCGA